MTTMKKTLSVLKTIPEHLLADSEAKKIPILMYHSISEPKHIISEQLKPFTVSPTSFSEHIKYLHEHGYTSLTVTQLITLLYHDKQNLPERPVVVTFDDGFANFFTDALPILKRYNFVATLYIATAFIGGTSRWLWREKETTHPMLTWKQIQEIHAQGIECGGHSHTHPQLDIVPLSVARREIIQSKELLEQHLGQKVYSFAYPHGYHSGPIQQVLKDVGYTSACAVKYEMCQETTNPFSLARLLASEETRVDTLAALLNSSPPSPAKRLYKQACAPLWRLVRYYSYSTTKDSSLISEPQDGSRKDIDNTIPRALLE
jgi:peptidoglycan/xylan/chitin deacetylase (PgdA/CDA1 family)